MNEFEVDSLDDDIKRQSTAETIKTAVYIMVGVAATATYLGIFGGFGFWMGLRLLDIAVGS